MGLLDSWKKRRARKRAVAEGRHLVSEARHVLKKRSDRIPESARAEIEKAIDNFESAATNPESEELRESLAALDATIDKHLAFARKSTVREYAESIGVAVFIALFLRAFVVEAFQIPSGSMIPTLEIGDHIFVAKFSYGIQIPLTDKKILKLADPKRGDVVVFKFPQNPSIDYIKRVVALPGETVEVKNDQIFIDGKPMARERIDGPCEGSDPSEFFYRCDLWNETLDGKEHVARFRVKDGAMPYGPFKVPEGQIFVMGDNRDNSNDSRAWGTVPLDYVKGKALIVWWSRQPISREDGNVFSSLKDWLAGIRWGRFGKAVD